MARFALIPTLLALAACGGGSSTTPANCTTFTDLTLAAAPEIDFGGALGLNYVPKCAMVHVNQTVTFRGDFGTHPLSQTSGPPAIPSTTGTPGVTSSIQVVFPTAAIYDYQCDVHHASGMVGAVKAVP